MARTALSAESRAIRARLAQAQSVRRPPEEIDRLRREFRESKLRDIIDAEVAAAPPLTQEQRDRLAALLSPVRPASLDDRRP